MSRPSTPARSSTCPLLFKTCRRCSGPAGFRSTWPWCRSRRRIRTAHAASASQSM
jgi:hypothetical protein